MAPMAPMKRLYFCLTHRYSYRILHRHLRFLRDGPAAAVVPAYAGAGAVALH
jgi:hypothetical protein